MDKTSHIASVVSFLIVILIIFGVVVFGPNAREGQYAVIGEEVIQLSVSDDKDERIQGLSGREEISPREGMLFIFEEEGLHGIWMNDMNFAVDILWLKEESPGVLRVVYLEREVQPETFPNVFEPDEPVLYVLELGAGVSEMLDVKIGSLISVFLE